ncbi:MAG: hypothetical protein EOP06_14240 [Proteobacteria bacterium]|nr:MAG: hypothetical protein EOP06_14240 [Pseudomonadota bacterium]
MISGRLIKLSQEHKLPFFHNDTLMLADTASNLAIATYLAFSQNPKLLAVPEAEIEAVTYEAQVLLAELTNLIVGLERFPSKAYFMKATNRLIFRLQILPK